MANAISTNSLAGRETQRAEAKRNRAKLEEKKRFASKTYDELTEAERGQLLKAVAIRLGMIQPDP